MQEQSTLGTPSPSPSYDKSATSPEGIDHLRREAQILRLAKHPNVVGIVSYEEGPDFAELRLAQVSGAAVGSTTLTVRQIAQLFASLAATVAYLHERAIAHGSIARENVLVTANNRPVLIGFDQAEICSENLGLLSNDVADLGQLLESLVRPSVDNVRIDLADEERDATTSALRRRLLEIAGEASGIDVAKRPTSRELAVSLRDALGTGAVAKGSARRGKSKPHSSLLLAGVAALVVCLGIVGVGIWQDSSPRPTAGAMSSSCKKANSHYDIDQDGCYDDVDVAAGMITVNQERYLIGTPNDVLSLGDWNCDGKHNAAMLRVASGEIFVFDQWPAAGQDTPARRIGSVKDAVDITPKHSGACDIAAIRTKDGKTLELDLKTKEAQ